MGKRRGAAEVLSNLNRLEDSWYWVGKFTAGSKANLLRYTGEGRWEIGQILPGYKYLLWQELQGDLPEGFSLQEVFAVTGHFSAQPAHHQMGLFFFGGEQRIWYGYVDEKAERFIINEVGQGYPVEDALRQSLYWVGDYDGDRVAELLLYDPSSGTWSMLELDDGAFIWRGAISGADGDTFRPVDGAFCLNGPFSSAGKCELLGFHPGEQKWYLGTFADGKLLWHYCGDGLGLAPESLGNKQQYFVGNFVHSAKSEILFAHPENKSFWLGFVQNGQLNWRQVGEARDKFTFALVGNYQGENAQILILEQNYKKWQLGRMADDALCWEMIHDFNGTEGLINKLYGGNFLPAPEARFGLCSCDEVSGNIYFGHIDPRGYAMPNYSVTMYDYFPAFAWPVWDNANKYKAAIIRKFKLLDRHPSEIGDPCGPIAELADGSGYKLVCTKGIIINRRGEEPLAITGDIYQQWVCLGKEYSALGYPLGEAERFRQVYYQRFEKGVIVENAEGSVSAALNNGDVLPERSYTLSLERIVCHKKGAGADQAGLCLNTVITYMDPETGKKKANFTSFEHNFKEGGDKPFHTVLYAGRLKDAYLVSFLGLENRDQDKTREVMDRFKQEALRKDEYFVLSHDEFALLVQNAVPLEAVNGAAMAAIAGDPAMALLSGCTVAGCTGVAVSGVSGGAVGGGLYGVLVALSTVPMVAAVLAMDEALKQEILMVDRGALLAANLLPYFEGGPRPRNTETKIDVAGETIHVEITFEEAENGDLLEKRKYTRQGREGDAGSQYTIVVRHHIH
jgi:hypothetical protein